MPTTDVPHVAVLTAATLQPDGREQDVAVALTEAGFRVTLVAPAEGGGRRTWLGDVRVARVPVTWTLRMDADRARSARRRWRPWTAVGVTSPRDSGLVRVVDGSLATGWRVLDGALARLPVVRESSVLPEVDDLELAFGPVLDELRPSALCTLDALLVPTAAAAVGRARLRGRDIVWVHAAGPAATYRSRPGRRASRLARAAGRLEGRASRVADELATGTAEDLPAVLGTLLGFRAKPASPDATRRRVVETVTRLPRRRVDLPGRLAIGPANMAGQAWAWAKAIEAHSPGVTTEVMAVDRGSALTFRVDELVPLSTYTQDREWAERLEARALETWTHALFEAGRPLFGLRNGKDFSGDAALLRAAGVRVGLVFHGSEVRDPRLHAQQTPWSPFQDPDDELTARLQSGCDRLRPLIAAFDSPKFVSTPDLLAHVPGSRWLPVVVDLPTWTTSNPLLERHKPIVLHVPSRASLKGSEHVDAAMAPLVQAGLVDYRRLEGVPPEQMPTLIHDADIVLDQFALGSYGVLAAQAMAAGRVVIGHVTDAVRDECGGDVPVLEADPHSLTDLVRRVVEDRTWAVEAAGRGPGYVRRLHDGTVAAGVLIESTGLAAVPV